MKKTTVEDMHVVVDVRAMEALLTIASQSDDQASYEKLLKHIRKFNPNYANYSPMIRKAKEKKDAIRKEALEHRAFLKKHTGKIVKCGDVDVKVLGRPLGKGTPKNLVLVEAVGEDYFVEVMVYDKKTDRSKVVKKPHRAALPVSRLKSRTSVDLKKIFEQSKVPEFNSFNP